MNNNTFNWKAIAICDNVRRGFVNQLNVGSTYYLANPYTLGGSVYVEVFSDKHFKNSIGRLLYSHFSILAASDMVDIKRDIHSKDAMVITVFALPEDVKNFLSFMNIWGPQGNKHEDGTTSYEIMCPDFIKSREFYNLMKMHGIKVNI